MFEVLATFRAFTGCDQTSSFMGHGKKGTYKTWLNFPEVTNAFKVISEGPSAYEIIDIMPTIERYVVLMYDRASNSNL